MLHLPSILSTLAVGCTLVLRPVAVDAQRAMGAAPRFEIMPFAGYQWGGSFDTDALATIPAGELALDGSFGWGGVFSYLAPNNSAVELIYLRQDTDIRFDPNLEASRELGGFTNNYIQLGGRWDLPVEAPIRPFLSGSLGINILDPGGELGSNTRFSFGLGGGARYMFGPTQRVGLRADLKWWVTPVPSGDYGSWCTFYGCFAVEGTAWVNQGQATAGLVFAF